jgi:hypothetical protein
MRTIRTILISALNVAMHKPHSPERYMALLWDTRRSRNIVKLGELHAAMVGHLNGPREYRKGAILTGEIYRFVKLDPEMPWFNLIKAEVASDEEMAQISLPEHLLPNLQRIEFCFLPDSHKLWFISKDRKDSMSPNSAAKFFQILFDFIRTQKSYPPIEVSIIPDSESIEELLSIPRIDRIELNLVRPNPDDGQSTEARWKAKLERLNARKLTTEIIAADEAGITLSKEDKDDAIAIANNGNVRVIGVAADGTKIDESTASRPLRDYLQVNSEVETSLDVLTRRAS